MAIAKVVPIKWQIKTINIIESFIYTKVLPKKCKTLIIENKTS